MACGAANWEGIDGNIPTPVLALLLGCVATIFPAVGRSTTSAQARLAALPAQPAAPADNPSTPDRVALGRLLFWDPILSGQRTSPARPAIIPSGILRGPRPFDRGQRRGPGPRRSFLPDGRSLVKRNSQTVLNVAFNGSTRGIPAPRPRRCSGTSGSGASRRKRSSRSRRSTKCVADLSRRSRACGRGRSSDVVPGLPPHVCRAFGGSTPVNDGNLGEHWRPFSGRCRREYAVRSLHAR